jgi:hypothetical protein
VVKRVNIMIEVFFLYIVSFINHILPFTSPEVFSAGMVSHYLQFIYMLNPMSGIIDVFWWTFRGMNHVGIMFFLSNVLVYCIYWKYSNSRGWSIILWTVFNKLCSSIEGRSSINNSLSGRKHFGIFMESLGR